MSDDYNIKSCSAFEKPYYRPIEAALRWCNLIDHEVDILTATGVELFPPLAAFPRWPCLRLNAEIIFDAIQNNELPHGRDGRSVGDDHVAPHRLTVRHNDLKAWMATHRPDQKPKFLFDEVERTTHTAINKDAFVALQVELAASKVRLGKAEIWAKEKQLEIKQLTDENKSLSSKVAINANPLVGSERETLLIIIAALAKEAKIDIVKTSKAGDLIATITQTIGAPVGATTIETHLKKIPQALVSRAK